MRPWFDGSHNVQFKGAIGHRICDRHFGRFYWNHADNDRDHCRW